jgi:hypothetical protein
MTLTNLGHDPLRDDYKFDPDWERMYFKQVKEETGLRSRQQDALVVLAALDRLADLARLCAEQDDLLRRLSEWDVLNLAPGSGDDGPYWQGEIAKVRAKLTELEAPK